MEEGESYASPWLSFSTGDGLDAVARRYHAHLRARPRPVGSDRPVTLNVWEAVYFDHSLDRLVALADYTGATWQASSLYGPLGTVAPPLLPDGVRSVETSVEVTVGDLAVPWLPTTGRPVSTTAADAVVDPSRPMAR